MLTVDSNSVDYKTIVDIAKEYNAEIIGYISFSGDYQLELSESKDENELKTLSDSIAENERIETCMILYGYEITVDFDDPWNGDADWTSIPAGSNWWTEAINVNDVWDYYIENKSAFSEIKVGVFDSVFQTDHDDLNGVFDNVWYNPEDFKGYYKNDSDDDYKEHNRAENAIRPFAVGRKNWLFNNTERRAKCSATLYSIISTAQENGLDAKKYLTELFSQPPGTIQLPWHE